MDIRAHSIALISVIVGLGLPDLQGNLNRLIRARVPVAWDVLPLVVAAVRHQLLVGPYTGAVVAASAGNSAEFLAGMLLPILLYLMCAAALPTGRDDNRRPDMRAGCCWRRRCR